MAGYVRQSTASIINGSPITAPPINAEFNQLLAAFNASTGHGHTGATGDSPKINLATSVSGYLPQANGGMGGANKMDATTTPAVTNDNTEGYAPGSLWENTTTGRIYICVGSATGAAVWRELVQVESGNAILPVATDTIDLGSNTQRFQDLFLSGGIAATGNVTVGGTLTVTSGTTLSSTLGVTGDVTVANLSASGTTVITSIDLNSGAIDSTTIGTTTPAAGTFTTLNANTSLVAATADINGGTVDNATIGASTPSTGSFTDLGASGTTTLATVDINGGAIDGTNIGANASATGAFTTISTSGQATLATVDINGGAIDGATIGSSSTSSGAFTTLSASGGYTGTVTGTVTGNVTGNLTGDVTGDVTGNITGNVTSSGSSSFNNVTIDGTLNMNAGTTATIQNLTSPTNDTDAATKGYVDTSVANLVDSAPGNLNTLNELAAALNDDNAFSTTVTNSIATKLPLAGGTMSGAIAMGTSKITGLGDPTAAQDASTKTYTDTQRDTRVAKSGDTMSGNLAMGTNKITGLGTPTSGTDATTKTYVDGVLGSATAAATSATNAATSETNAATSASNASTSATSASSSATSAAASYDSFDDRYLGAKSSAPSVDNDGDALVIGALYFDTTAGAMKVYSASGWTNAGSSVNGTSDRQTYTVSSAGQTVFSATYDSGYVDVYMNGVKLLNGTDFTATNGTSITLASGAAINDIIDIVAYGTFVLADHLTETQSDAKYALKAGDTFTGDVVISSTNSLGVGGAIGTGYAVDVTGLSGYDDVMRLTAVGTNIGARINLTNTGTGVARINATNNSLALQTGGTTAVVIDSSNRIGIGATPNTNIDASSFPAALTLGDQGVLLGNATSTQIGHNFYWSGSAFKYLGSGKASRMYQQAGDIVFQTTDTSGSADGALTLSTALTIDSSQNATFNGDVDSATFFRAPNFYTGTGSQAFAANGNDINIVSQAGTTQMILKNDGCTTIQTGTSNVADEFIFAKLYASVSPGNKAGILIGGYPADGYAKQGIFIDRYSGYTGNGGRGDLLLVNRDANDTSVPTSADAKVRITPEGNVKFPTGNLQFGASGSETGQIEINSTRLLLRSTGDASGIRFDASGITPFKNGSESNGGVDLGHSGGKFYDLHLTNRVKLGASGGIEFGHGVTSASGASASSTLLDHYEEGTFTPAWSGVSSASFTQQFGKYTRIGNRIFGIGRVTSNSHSGSGNQVQITGFPYAAANNTAAYHHFNYGHLVGFSYTGVPYGYVVSNASYAVLQVNNNGSIANVTFPSSSVIDIIFHFMYEAA